MDNQIVGYIQCGGNIQIVIHSSCDCELVIGLEEDGEWGGV